MQRKLTSEKQQEWFQMVWKILHLPTKMAIKLSKESLDWMGKNNSVAGTKDRYDVRLNKLFGKHQFQDGPNLNYQVKK